MKKNVKRINESQLKTIVAESVKKVLEEGGHLYWKDEDGTVHTNSKELYRGVPGAIYISHGEWSDPEILYNNHELNYWDVEECLWDSYESDCEESNKEASEEGFDGWLEEMGVDYVQGELDNLVWSMDGCNENVFPRNGSTCPIEEDLAQIESAYENIADKVDRGIMSNSKELTDAMRNIYKGMYAMGCLCNQEKKKQKNRIQNLS